MRNEMKMRWTVKIWNIPSKSQLNTYYDVRLCTDGSFVCSCPDFQFRGNECRHIKKVKRGLAGEAQKNKLPGVET
ncbi:MAG: SWIM zinc finger family protein [Proteobacteria bacterium]|nr:SWIM zinc finger family protein [Pseudomonadota bacterium]